MSLFYAYVYVLYELFLIDNVVRLLSCANICACHVYFAIHGVTRRHKIIDHDTIAILWYNFT